MDGDLGPYDVLEPRLQRADTVIVLDVARWRCLWRSFRRSRERLDFWRWLWTWRRRSRPQVLAAIAAHADQAHAEVLEVQPTPTAGWRRSQHDDLENRVVQTRRSGARDPASA